MDQTTQQQILNKTLEKCDPYSAFGVFCNANGLIEGLFIIAGVVLLVVLSLWFVKKNQEVNADKHREKYRKYTQ
ncbi:hypothetical protein [Persephonella sp.]